MGVIKINVALGKQKIKIQQHENQIKGGQKRTKNNSSYLSFRFHALTSTFAPCF